MQDIPPQMRRSVSADMAKSMGGPMGMPQHFPPRGMPVQQHNIMGQPFIELRHRAAENRLRMPPGVMPGNVMDPSMQVQRPPGFPGAPEFRFPSNQGPRMMDPMGAQSGHVQLSSSMENLNQPQHRQSLLMRSMSQPASNDSNNLAVAAMMMAAPPAGHSENITGAPSEAVEEKQDAEESTVKDFEDVEVKDLVDADLENLNLDPEDGKDLDLETNDLHLEDLFSSGKFDIIAYTDPDLDDIKKDMFNEELDLSDPMEDNSDSADIQKSSFEKKNPSTSSAETSSDSTSVTTKSEVSSGQTPSDVKQEAEGNLGSASLVPSHEIKTEVKDGQKFAEATDQQTNGNALTPNQQGVLSDSTPVLSSLLIKQQPGEQSLNPMADSVNQGGNLMPQPNQVTDAHQHSPGLAMGQTLSEATSAEASMAGFGADSQVGLGQGLDQSNLSQAQQAMLNQALAQQSGQQQRPLLLEEQPLLLQDLLDQERQEQQQQRQMQAMIRQRSSDSFFPNIGTIIKLLQCPHKCNTLFKGRMPYINMLFFVLGSTGDVFADFDAITDPIMKAKMVALKGINKVMVQNNMGMSPMVMNR